MVNEKNLKRFYENQEQDKAIIHSSFLFSMVLEILASITKEGGGGGMEREGRKEGEIKKSRYLCWQVISFYT